MFSAKLNGISLENGEFYSVTTKVSLLASTTKLSFFRNVKLSEQAKIILKIFSSINNDV